MSRYDLIDLSTVPPPDSVEVLDFDAALAEWFQAYRAECETYGIAYDVEALRSDPIGWVLRVAAYRGDIYLKQIVNDAIKAVLVPTAKGADLDNVVADFSLVRRILVAGDPANGIEEVKETDSDLRARRVLAPEALSSAGPYGAYLFHAKAAHPDIKDVGVYGPEYDFVDDGRVLLVLLSSVGNGFPAIDVQRAVAEKLRAWDAPDLPGYVRPSRLELDGDLLRPDTDWVTVRAATIQDYTIEGTLTVRPGPDASAVKASAEARILAYADKQARVGAVHTRDSLIAAGRLMEADGSSPVVSFKLTQPVTDIDPGPLAAARIGSLIGLTVEVADG